MDGAIVEVCPAAIASQSFPGFASSLQVYVFLLCDVRRVHLHIDIWAGVVCVSTHPVPPTSGEGLSETGSSFSLVIIIREDLYVL
jgi:hypothetical protein